MSLPPLPTLVVLDVNETLSDLSPLGAAFAAAGLQEHEAEPWFAGLLRDAFALTAAGAHPLFGELARESLLVRAHGRVADPDATAEQVLEAVRGLPPHPDVADGIRALTDLGTRVVTLSNGPAATAEALLGRAGVAHLVERTLSVDDAPAWKPDRRAYGHALDACGVSDAAEALLAAVHPWDVDGARRAGLRTAWVDRRGSRYPAYAAPADLTVTSLVDLADHLRAR
ncbi:haloacid dehalogenase type II [Nocardioides sp. Leaf374]|uniref:haloacid dehalogenase type II n=1 Tax=Nocardioides sp. Leaf374 TaxID=2876560 RepID=UPI001E4B519D|nr:haloacid dehalogenase type II [Nocardioides sp. Leaf374]